MNNVRDYLEQTGAEFRRTTQRALGEALVSVAQTVLLLGVGGLLGGVVLGVRAGDTPPPPPVVWVSGSLSLLLLGGGVLRGVDAVADVEHAAFLNSSRTRNRVTEKVLDAGLDYLTTPQYVAQLHTNAPAHRPVAVGGPSQPVDERAWLETLYQQPAIVPPVAPTMEEPSRQASQPPPPVGTLDLARDLGHNPRSSIIVGQPGAGKGRLVSAALTQLKHHHPEVSVWMVNPKNDPSEDGYWTMVDDVCAATLAPFATRAEVDAFTTQVDSFVKRFKAAPSPKLLVMDELMMVKEATPKAWFDQFMAGANALCSMGRSLKEWGWLITQSPNATDLGISGGARNVYRRVLLVHASDKGLLTGKSTFFSGAPEPELFDTESRRVFFDSAETRWGSLPCY